VPGEGHLPEVERPIVLAGRGLTRRYVTATGSVTAVEGVDVDVRAGALTALVGPSGSGKSTVLRLLACLDRPDDGEVRLDGAPVHVLAPRWRRELRRRRIAFLESEPVHNLLEGLDAGANVRAAARWRGGPHVAVNPSQALDDVGLGGREGARISDLSGGEQQRLALAVALANEPDVVLADEPTAELDAASSAELFAALRNVSGAGVTVLVTTHDPQVATSVERTIEIRDGRTSAETLRAAGGGEAGVEFAVLDAQGRLQLPAEHVDALGLKRRVRVRMRDGALEIRPQDERPEEER
jgi:ABC-type lipoprotein export system ATPase subunit